MQEQNIPTRLIRFPEVMARTSYSRPTIYVKILRGEFPKPVKLGPKSVAFVEHEIDQWLEDMAAHGRVAWADSSPDGNKHQAA